MNYADLLQNRPFQGGMGGMMPNPYERLMRSIMGDIQNFRQQFPKQGGDGMRPIETGRSNGMRRTGPPLLSYGDTFGGPPQQARAPRPVSDIVRSTFGNG